MAYSYAVPGSLLNTRSNTLTQSSIMDQSHAMANVDNPFISTKQPFVKAQDELMEDSTPGGLNDDFAGITTRSRIMPSQPTSGLASHPAFKASQYTDILNAPHINYWDIDDNRFDDIYKHDTMGSPYINSHKLNLEDFHPGMFTQQFSGAFTGADRPEVIGGVQSQYKNILAGSDNRQNAIKLFAQRFGTPENLKELVKTGHLHSSDLAALYSITNGAIPSSEPMMHRTTAQQLTNVMEGSSRPGNYQFNPSMNKKKLTSSNGSTLTIPHNASTHPNTLLSSLQSTVRYPHSAYDDAAHLSKREKEELKNIGINKDLQIGHEKALQFETHPRFSQRKVFNPHSTYGNWDSVGTTEIPRYPTYSYLEFNNYGNRGE